MIAHAYLFTWKFKALLGKVVQVYSMNRAALISYYVSQAFSSCTRTRVQREPVGVELHVSAVRLCSASLSKHFRWTKLLTDNDHTSASPAHNIVRVGEKGHGLTWLEPCHMATLSATCSKAGWCPSCASSR